MNHATQAVAARSPNAVPTLPRQTRIGAAIASAIVTCTLFGSVVAGLSATDEGAAQILAQSHPATRT
jgi:hypothetical protein